MALLPPTRLQPPTQHEPLMPDSGAFSEPWARHNQDVVDRLANIQATTQLKQGVTDGSAAAAGDIGEYVTASLGAVSLASSVIADIGSLSLTAGDWDVGGQVQFSVSAAGATYVSLWVSDVAVTPLDPNRIVLAFATGSAGNFTRFATGQQRFLKAAPATIHLGAQCIFTGTVSASGTIWARRVR